MISRVVSVGFLFLFVALAGMAGPASSLPCAEASQASADEVTELAMGVTHAFGSDASARNGQRPQPEPTELACATADEVVVVTAG